MATVSTPCCKGRTRLSSSTCDPFAGTYSSPDAAAYGSALSLLGYWLKVEAALAVSAAPRGNIARISSATAAVAGELGALAQDIVLLSGSNIGELVISDAGGSSAMPHKRNAARAVNALACAYRVPGAASTILAMMPQGLQRDPGRWQAEWGAWSDVLQLTAACAHHLRVVSESLVVDEAAARRNVAGLLESLDDAGAACIRDAESIVDRLIGDT